MQNISKLCADHLRSFASDRGIKLKASHAHELVAAYFGYQSRAAMLADTLYPVSNLNQIKVLVLADPVFLEQRRQCLQELPAELPDKYALQEELFIFLVTSERLVFDSWGSYEHLAKTLADDYLLKQGHVVIGQLITEPILVRTSDVFGRGPLAEGIKEEILDDGVTIVVTRQYYDWCRLLSPMFGDRIHVTITIKLQRVAGQIGYAKPDITHEVRELSQQDRFRVSG